LQGVPKTQSLLYYKKSIAIKKITGYTLVKKLVY